MMTADDYIEEAYEVEFTVVRDLHGRALYITYDLMLADSDNPEDEDEAEELEMFRWRTSQREEWHETDNEVDMKLVIEAFQKGHLCD